MSATSNGSGNILDLLVPLNNPNSVYHLHKEMF